MEEYEEHSETRRPNPSDLSDTEVLDWLNEYCECMEHSYQSDKRISGYTVYSDVAEKTFASSLREAVCMADALMQEDN